MNGVILVEDAVKAFVDGAEAFVTCACRRRTTASGWRLAAKCNVQPRILRHPLKANPHQKCFLWDQWLAKYSRIVLDVAWLALRTMMELP
jgi:hypothetical protein